MNSRSKGKRGELEACEAIREHWGVSAERTAQRCGKGGTADIRTDIPGVHVEVKRVAKLAVQDYMEQAKRDRVEPGTIPVVVMRCDRGEWLCMMRLEDVPRFAYTAKFVEPAQQEEK